MAPVAWPSPSRCVSERSPKQQLRGSRESEETRPPAREHCTGLPADHAYGIVPPKKLRGLRGTVIILRDRADAVTAGVLTKELLFFFLDTSSALALHRTPSLLVKHVRGG